MKRFGLIGHPLGHSFSKAYFTEKFKKEGLICEYLNFDIEEISLIKQVIADHPDLKGLNVTIPYKEAILPYLDELDAEAAEVGAVNTVKVFPNGRLKGYNTDILGIRAALQTAIQQCGNHDEPMANPALILGTGGASKAVKYVLRKNDIPFHLVSRTLGKGDFTYKELNPENIKEHRLIINATPVGMAPHTEEAPTLPYEAITPQHILFDLIYNPEETLFLKHGRQHGANTINGLTMLHVQAEASWSIWTMD